MMENERMKEGKRVHRIKTQRVEVEFENPEAPFKTRDLLSELCRYRLIPAMEKLFEEKYAGDRLLCIPQLLIDAGRLKAENWEDEFVKAVIRRLDDCLNAYAGDQRRKDLSNTSLSGDPGKTENKRHAAFILYYLKKGLQPWNSPYRNNEQLKNGLLNLLKSSGSFPASGEIPDRPSIRSGSAAQSNQAAQSGHVVRSRPAAGTPDKSTPDLRDDFSRELLELLMVNLNAVKRLLYLLPEKEIFSLLIKKSGDRGEIRKTQKKWNRIFKLAGLPKPEHKVVFWQAFSILHSRGENPCFSEALSREISGVLAKCYKSVFLKLPEVLEKYPILRPGERLIGSSNAYRDNPVHEKPAFRQEEEAVYITNAGLVLLHPFLHALFENTGHTVKNRWDSDELQQRSIVLSHYLATGADDYTEHDLFLNKVLTGFPAEEALPLDIVLSDFEKKEAAELLECVISHWKALKNTGIPALRATFLLRPGKITQRGKGWLLEVDQRTPDLLLSKIPWGFSTIKTSWMEEILSVEWA